MGYIGTWYLDRFRLVHYNCWWNHLPPRTWESQHHTFWSRRCYVPIRKVSNAYHRLQWSSHTGHLNWKDLVSISNLMGNQKNSIVNSLIIPKMNSSHIILIIIELFMHCLECKLALTHFKTFKEPFTRGSRRNSKTKARYVYSLISVFSIQKISCLKNTKQIAHNVIGQSDMITLNPRFCFTYIYRHLEYQEIWPTIFQDQSDQE